jgi:pimeloyl-ACP methyl ester carboxylesterase
VKRIKVNGVELCVETFGDPSDPPVLLVGVTMLSWPDELCAALAGRYVVRYDLRDAGQSTFADPDAPDYDLRDLATDAYELLVALDLGPAHVAGVGVGGFIAQLLALDHPGQVASLTLVSTRPVAPGPVDPDLPDHAPEMGKLFGRPAPDWTDRDSVVDYMTGSARVMSGSRGFDEQDVRAAAGSSTERTGQQRRSVRATSAPCSRPSTASRGGANGSARSPRRPWWCTGTRIRSSRTATGRRWPRRSRARPCSHCPASARACRA